MNDTDVFIKTPRGVEEVRKRSAKLPQRLRTILIMVDGNLRLADLKQAADTLGAPPDFMDALVQNGLVEAVQAAARPAVAAPPAPMAPAASPPLESQIRRAAPELPSAAGSDAERFRVAVKFMNETVVDALGLRAFFFTLKLEKCSSRAELEALMPEYIRAIEKGNGDATARVLQTRLREMLRS